MADAKMLKVTLRAEPDRHDARASAQTLRGLGLTRIGKSVIVQRHRRPTRGMIAQGRASGRRWRAERWT